jgi:autotransporter-associated beta strand protein
MPRSPIRRLGSLATLLSLTLLAAQANAATFTWTAASSGVWSNAGNWTGGAPASAATTLLIFNDSATGYTATNDLAANPWILNGMTFNNLAGHVVNIAGANPLNFQPNGATAPTITAGAGNVTIGQAVQLGVSGTAATLTVSSTGGTVTFTNAVTDLSGATPPASGSNVIKTGAGTLVFAGTNGTTNSSFAQLSIQGGAVNVTGGTLTLNTPDITTSGLQLGAASGQTVSFTASGGSTTNVEENIFAGQVAGSTGTINVIGLGTTLNAHSSTQGGAGSDRFAVGQLGTGFLNVLNGGVVNASLVYAGRGAGGIGTIVVDGPGSAINCNPDPGGLNVGQLAFATGANSSATVTISNGGSMTETRSAAAEGNFFLAGGAGSTGTFTLNGANSTLNISGQAQIGGSGGNAGGTGTLTANVGSVVNLTGPLLLYPNATVNVNTGTFNIGGLDDATATITGETVTLGSTSSTLTINGRPGQGTSLGQEFYSGTISGSGNVTLTGNTIQGLFGTSTYTGTTNINGGKLSFGALTNIGTGNITFNGGTLQWANNGAANTSDITTGREILIFNGGATFDTMGNTITLANRIGGPATTFSAGGITVTGGGVLTLGGTNTYFGPTVIQNGVLVVTTDANLGSATDNGFNSVPNTVSGTPSGTLVVGGTGGFTTSRLFNMNGGMIQVAPASPNTQTVTFNGSLVQGATLDATPGGSFATDATNGAGFNNITTSPTVTLASNSGHDQFFNFINGGTLNIAANIPTATPVTMRTFTNQGSGSVTIGASTLVNAAGFQTYGVTTLSPGTTALPTQLTNNGNAPLYFNGGSRTFISVAGQQAQFNAGIDLHGNNAIVAGGLFVNNGYVVDTVGTGTHTVIADYNALVKGAGFYQNSVITQNGGKFQSGNSPGVASFGSFVLGKGGVNDYVFAIDDATGAAGPIPDAAGKVSGWGLVKSISQGPNGANSGNFTWAAGEKNPLTVSVQTLVNPTTVGTDVPGQMDHFNPNQAYAWSAVTWAGSYAGPTDVAVLDATTNFDLSGFANPMAGRFGWALDVGGHNLSLTYTPSAVPEPGSMALLGAAGAGISWAIRRRKAAKK